MMIRVFSESTSATSGSLESSTFCYHIRSSPLMTTNTGTINGAADARCRQRQHAILIASFVRRDKTSACQLNRHQQRQSTFHRAVGFPVPRLHILRSAPVATVMPPSGLYRLARAEQIIECRAPRAAVAIREETPFREVRQVNCSGLRYGGLFAQRNSCRAGNSGPQK